MTDKVRAAAQSAIERYTEAGYALVVAGVAFLWPPAALIVAAAYLVALAVIADRRSV